MIEKMYPLFYFFEENLLHLFVVFDVDEVA
jgi:hypothetical protein